MLWILGIGLLLGLAGAVSGLLVSGGHVGAAPTIPAGCVFASNTATITLGGGTTTVAVNSAGQLIVTIPGQAAAQCGTGTLGGTGSTGITSLAFQLTSPTAPASDTLIIDESAAAIPCTVTSISGTVGSGSTPNAAFVDIKGAPNTDITIGNKSLNLDDCASNQGQLTGIGSLKLEPHGDATVSTLGSASDPAGVPTTFVAGQVAASGDTETFEADNPGSKLDFSQAYATCPQLNTNPPSTSVPGSCALDISDSGGTAVMNDTSSTQTTAVPFTANYAFSTGTSNITSFVGLQSGPTVFGGSAGTFTLTGFLGGSQVNADAGTENYTVTASNSTFVGGSDQDTFTVTGNNNVFDVESGADSFYDIVTSGIPSNTLDFSDVATSSSAPLVVNASGALQTVAATHLNNGQAVVGTTSYTFLDAPTGPNSGAATNFTSIKGATNGFTQFLVGNDGGLALTGQGSGSSADSAAFFGNTGAVVNLSGGPETSSAQISPTVTLSSFSLGLDQVLVGLPGAGTTSCTSAICDTLINIPTVTGPTGGFSTFYAGAGPTAYTFGDSGSNNTFIGGSGQDTFTSAGNFNTFVPGSGSATLTESTSAQGASNTIDFSNVPVGNATGCAGPCSLTVNVSGSPTVVSNFGAAVLSSGQAVSTYSFGGSGGADFTRFIGADDGATTFQGGLGNYTYTGQGPGNSLDFSAVAPQRGQHPELRCHPHAVSAGHAQQRPGDVFRYHQAGGAAGRQHHLRGRLDRRLHVRGAGHRQPGVLRGRRAVQHAFRERPAAQRWPASDRRDGHLQPPRRRSPLCVRARRGQWRQRHSRLLHVVAPGRQRPGGGCLHPSVRIQRGRIRNSHLPGRGHPGGGAAGHTGDQRVDPRLTNFGGHHSDPDRHRQQRRWPDVHRRGNSHLQHRRRADPLHRHRQERVHHVRGDIL